MTETEKALFICLESLADALSRKGALDMRDYVMRLAVIGSQTAGPTGTTMTDALQAHMERLMTLSDTGYPDGIGTSGETH